MRKINHFYAKASFSLLLISALLLQLAGCCFIPIEDTYATEYEISVTDRPYDFVNAENFPENEDTEYTYEPDLSIEDSRRIYYGAGTCTFLRDKKIVALFFLDDDESKWSKRDIQSFTNNGVLPALDFLEKQAELLEVDLNFEVWRFSSSFSKNLNLKYNGTVDSNLSEKGVHTGDLLIQTAKILGYSNDMALRWALMEKSGGVEIIPVFVLNKKGRSYAKANYIVSRTEYAENAVVFSGDGAKTSTVAHEILHLYGAEDLYTPEPRNGLALEIYPDDIMLHGGTRSIDEVKIDGFSAYALGWKRRPKICNNIEWYTSDEYKQYMEWYGW